MLVVMSVLALGLSPEFLVRSPTGPNDRSLGGETSCPDTSGWEDNGGVVVYFFVTVYIFIGVAILCDEFFVEALEQISEKLDLSDDVAGATFMAAGSSGPELFVSLADNVISEPKSVGIGTIIGSAIFNILVIIGVTAFMGKTALKLDWRPLVRDCGWYCLSIVLLVIVLQTGTSKHECGDDENGDKTCYVEWWEGMELFLVYILFGVYMCYNQRIMKMFCPHSPAADMEEGLPTGSRAAKALEMAAPRPDGSRRPSAVPLKSKASPPSSPRSSPDPAAGGAVVNPLNATLSSTRQRSRGRGKRRRLSSSSMADVACQIISERQLRKDLSQKALQLVPRGRRASLEKNHRLVATYGLKGKRFRMLTLSIMDEMERKKIASSPGSGDAEPEAQNLLSVDKAAEENDDTPGLSALRHGGHVVLHADSDDESDDEGPGDDESDAGEYFDILEMPKYDGSWSSVGEIAWFVLIFPLMFSMKMTVPDVRFAPFKENGYGMTAAFTMSIVWIGGLSMAALEASLRFGCLCGLSPTVIGLTIVAAGTSVPDAITSVVVAQAGQGNMAVSNAIGSNVFDILVGLGLPFMLSVFRYGDPVPIQTDDLTVSLVFLFGVVVAVLVLMLITGFRMFQWTGGVLLLLYVGFVVYQLLA